MNKKLSIALFSTRNIGMPGLFQDKKLRTSFQSELLYKYFVPCVSDEVWKAYSEPIKEKKKEKEVLEQKRNIIEGWCNDNGIFPGFQLNDIKEDIEKRWHDFVIEQLQKPKASCEGVFNQEDANKKLADLWYGLNKILNKIEENIELNETEKVKALREKMFLQDNHGYICNLDNAGATEKKDPWFEYRFSLFYVKEKEGNDKKNFVYAVWPLATAATEPEKWYEALVDEIMVRHEKDAADMDIEIYLILHDKDISQNSPEKFIESHKEFSWKEKIKYKRTIAIFQHDTCGNPIYKDVIESASLSSPDDIIKELEKRTDANTTELGTQTDLENLSMRCVVTCPEAEGPFLEKIRKINEELKKIL